jgi:moderate conductance mechanosensitive channel
MRKPPDPDAALLSGLCAAELHIVPDCRPARPVVKLLGRNRRTRMWIASIGRALAIASLTICLAAPGLAQPPPETERMPPQVRDLIERLQDPVVREWLDRQRAGTAPSGATESAPERPIGGAASSTTLAGRIAAIRQHLAAIAAALPTITAELRRVGATLMDEVNEYGAVNVVLLLAAFVALGFGAEWVFRRATAAARRLIEALPLATVGERLRAVGLRLALSAGQVLTFALGSVGAFLALPWPPVLRQIILTYLVAFLVLRATLVAGRFLLAPPGRHAAADGARFRILPMGDDAARFWFHRIGLFAGWFSFGYMTLQLLDALGLPPDHRRAVAYLLGLGLLAIGIEIAWRRPQRVIPDAIGPGSGNRRVVTASLLSLYFVLLWLLWVGSAMNLFWLAVVALALPLLIATTRRAVNHILRPPGTATAEASRASIAAVCLERGVRAALIIGAVLLLAQKWGVDLGELAATDTMFTRVVRGALSAIVILLIADFVWHIVKAMIDRRLAEAEDPGQPNTEEARRRARVRTLLPIVRNILFIVMIAIAAMMALAALGVEIGPLIAGAGVIGVAIGFGAQTLVRDVISGMFYLLDDAFRVGEYIQSGNYKGTVESFSLRSVKLRHHRGPLYTVPFGALGAVQNMSRDWVIDKLTVGVTYDSDLDKAKKLVKQIGKELAADPEFAPHILEPLKMQGVAQFGDFAIQLQMKMMTRPGEQFTIRRRAYALLKKAFDANGIRFAFPTVQVAGDSDAASAAVAQRALELVQPAPAAR